MPRRALTPCNQPGCPELVAGRRYCVGHQKAKWREVDQGRPARAARGVTGKAWQALRLQVLRRDPLCVVCRRVPATVADHIVPRSQGGGDDLRNLRGVCRQCDARDTARFDGGFGNRIRSGKATK